MELREDLYINMLDEIFVNSKNNFIYSQKIITKTGIRDLLARMLCITLQILFFNEFMNNRYTFTKFIYSI